MSTARIQFETTKEKLELLAKLQAEIGASTRTDLLNTAVSLLMWAAKQKRSGRHIFSGEASGSGLVELSTPQLEAIPVASERLHSAAG